METSDDQLLTIKEAAAFLKVSESFMEKFSAKRSVPVYKPRHRVYFKRTDLIAYIESGYIASRPQQAEAAIHKLRSQRRESKGGSNNG